MRTEQGHAHAYTKYRLIRIEDYFLLFKSIFECKYYKYKSLTVHLPFEMQHSEVQNLGKAKTYIYFGELLKQVFNIKLYWENAPWLNYGKWNLKYKNTSWKFIPRNIELCLDTGHLMLGEKGKKEFVKTLKKIVRDRGKQIRFLHLHENNFRSDQHLPVPGKVVTRQIFSHLIQNRDYIIEKGE